MHIIERITAKDLTTHLLETELKEIIRERDEIIKDRFDKIIENSIVLDIDETLSLEEFFGMVAEKLGEKLNIKSNKLLKLFLSSEKTSSTVIRPNLAIPHIVIKGEHIFEILIARCKKGVVFSESSPYVQIIFVLLGTKDERNFHLCALAALAQITQDTNFEKTWMNAKGKEVLRDIILLGKRKR